MSLFADRVNSLGTENAFKLGEDIKTCEQKGMKVVRLNLGEPDFNSAENINRVAIRQIEAGNSHYADPQGIIALRESIARQVSRTRRIEVDPRQVVVTTGAKPPISYTMMSYANPADEVIYPSPGFPIYESWVKFVGAAPVPLQLEEEKGFRFDAGDLERLITPRTKLFIINSPSNPTGAVLTLDELQDLARVVREKASPEIRIYSDEVYEDIVFDGKKHLSIVSLPGMRERTIVVSGHSKSHSMTGWRLGYAVLPSVEEATVFKQLNINIFSCTPPFIQEAGLQALEGPENPGIVASRTAEFQQRRDLVVDLLNAIDGIRCNRPEGAFYVFPNIGGACAKLGVIDAYQSLDSGTRQRTSPSTMFQMFVLYEHGVATMDRRSFGTIGSEGKHFLRLSTATSLDMLREGVRRIEAATRDRDGFRRFFQAGEHIY